MDAHTIRHKFLSFFESKGHKIVPSAPLVQKNDPTLLFTNSGMVQFKDFFLGTVQPTARRVADTQKCLRVSGKHNDLEDVGMDTYHHTMFEMLGNWSFGDYFKQEAIAWGWELLTDVYQLPKDRLYVTVFGGDTGDGLPVDTESEDLWKKYVAPDRILYGDKKDNFWEMGETGPCGPCSEIHIDLRPDDERAKVSGQELVNQDHPLVVEIWNLVFIQFNRMASGKLEQLPEKHVDTGMGFERLCMAIQGKESNYDTDVFTPLIAAVEGLAGAKYGEDTRRDVAIRVVADHVRAVSFTIADGQLPSNTGAGYVIRRILRRALRYGYSYLQLEEPFLCKLVPTLAAQMKDAFPELHQQLDYVQNVIYEEERSFLATLERGMKRIGQVLQELPGEQGKKVIDGAVAFELFDTYGFPFDLTGLIAKEQGATVDEARFKIEMERQRARSKADAEKTTGDWIVLSDENPEFVGYDTLHASARVVRRREVKQKNKTRIQIVLDKTPFYAESGGQVGNTGLLTFAGGTCRVLDTKKENDLIVHDVNKIPDDVVEAQVDGQRRDQIMGNHSATHLLHAALRQVLGPHVEQRGSLVNEKGLRFDFTHFTAMQPEEIAQVENIVNDKVRENIRLQEDRDMPIEEAKRRGAMALFGEKYGDTVRMVTFDSGFSVELCGGTHVKATGKIGLCKIVSEGSVAAGVRRIEALTGQGAMEHLNVALEAFTQMKELLRNPADPVASLASLLEERKQLERTLEEASKQQADTLIANLARQAKHENGQTLIIEKVTAGHADVLKSIAYALRNQFDDLVLVLAANIKGRPFITVMLGKKTVAAEKLHAGKLVKELAREIQGGGGGQAFYATAGGKQLDGLDAVVAKAKEIIA